MIDRSVRLAFTIGALVNSITLGRGIFNIILTLASHLALVPSQTSKLLSIRLSSAPI